jgi:hypothetical protein
MKMKRISVLVILLCLALLIPSTAFGKTHRVQFMNDAVINGTTLDAGRYKVEVNGDNEALIYSGKELIAKAKVEVQPLGDATPNSVAQKADGTVIEIRLKDQKIVFVTS